MWNSKPALLGTLRLYTYPDEALWQQLTLPEVLQRDEVAQTGHRVSGMTAFPVWTKHWRKCHLQNSVTDKGDKKLCAYILFSSLFSLFQNPQWNTQFTIL